MAVVSMPSDFFMYVGPGGQELEFNFKNWAIVSPHLPKKKDDTRNVKFLGSVAQKGFVSTGSMNEVL